MKKLSKEKFLIMPDMPFKDNWDIFINLLLFFTCFVTPYRIAFIDTDNMAWRIINIIIDLLFFADIIIIFNSAYYDEDDFKLVTDRKVIALNYIKSWLVIDIIAVVPVELIFSVNDTNDYNGIARISRIGRLYKLVKLVRMVRILKVFRQRNQIFKQI